MRLRIEDENYKKGFAAIIKNMNLYTGYLIGKDYHIFTNGGHIIYTLDEVLQVLKERI